MINNIFNNQTFFSGGVGTIDRLLDYARDYIPKEDWSSTPLELKATAGLRLLPEEKANAILDGVKSLLHNSPFKGTYKKS